MISLKNLKSGPGGAAAIVKYCEHARERDGATGYYQADGAPSHWHGQGAEVLGLTGTVAGKTFQQAMEGRLPDGTDLSKRGNREDDRRMGVDLTFSAPKSVSVAALVAGDDRLLKAHNEAVRQALDFIEREVITARRGRGGTEREQTGSLVAAVYRHEDARPVDGHVDPQLHSHSIVINATQRSDGTWSAMDLQFGEHSVLMHTADAVYKSELALAAQQLGYDIRRTEDGFELAHVTPEQVDRFSGRREQIDAALAERGLTRDTADPTDRALANMATREDKKQTPRDEQIWAWRQEAREAGVVLDHPQERGQVARDLSAEAVKSGTRHIAERETVFSRDELRLESLQAGMGDADLRGVEREIAAAAGGLIEAGGNHYTTRDALHREQEILHRARSGAGKAEPFMTPDRAREYIDGREAVQGFRYSDGQRNALMLGLTSPDQVTGIGGRAGSGKTTIMADLVLAARAAGYEVIGIAPSARARDELASAGATVNRTVASFLASDHDFNERRVVIMDESGMVSAKDMDALLRKMEQEGGRLVLVGDPRQLKAVEAGTPFAQMMESGVIRHADIDEIQRQRDPALREIAQAFARGDAVRAVELARPYMQRVDVQAADPAKPTKMERQEAIARETAKVYLDLTPDDRARTLVVSGTNAVRVQVNEQIRNGLQERGEVSRNEIRITALSKADLTREKATHAESYAPGMVVRFSKRGADGQREVRDYSVTAVEGNRVHLRDVAGDEKIWNPAREKATRAYEPREMPVAAGDLIIFRENQGRGDDKITNGQTATIEKATKDGLEVRFEDGRTATMNPERGQTIDHAWCRTVHSSQGATVDNVIIAGEASRVATAETAYVACSRERDHLQIITDDPQRLQKSWEKWSEKKCARDAARVQDPQPDRLPELRREAAAELGREGDLGRARERADAKPAPEKEKESVTHDTACDKDKESGKHSPAPTPTAERETDQEKENAAASPEKSPVEMPTAAPQKTRMPEQNKPRDMEPKTDPATKNQAAEKAQGKEKDHGKEAAAVKTSPTAKDKSPTKDPVETEKTPEQAKPRGADSKNNGKETATEKGQAKSIEPPLTETPGKEQEKTQGKEVVKEKDQHKEATPKPPVKGRDLDHDPGLER